MVAAIQRIMAMPLPDLPQALPAPEEAASPEACAAQQQPLHVPAAAQQAPLQPAKLAAWRLFMEQVASPFLSIPAPTCSLDSMLWHRASASVGACFLEPGSSLGSLNGVRTAEGKSTLSGLPCACVGPITCRDCGGAAHQ